MSKNVGALWRRTYTKEGKEITYMSGVIDLGVGGQAQVAVFKNDRKEKDEHPDYRVVLSEKKTTEEPQENTEMEPF